MHNLIVLGCGRSGTSMVTGTLATAGYSTYVDHDAWGPDEYNQTGYYEDVGVIQINEAILSPVIPSAVGRFGYNDLDASEYPPSRWLGLLELGTPLAADEHLWPLMRNTLKKEPYCLKDPRFSYILGVWRPFLQNTKFICVFRAPILTIQSIVRFCRTFDHLKPLKIDELYAQTLWLLIYQHILQHHVHSGEWLFIHYDQMFEDAGLDRLEQFIEAKVDRDFPQQRYRKVAPEVTYNRAVTEVSVHLCLNKLFKPIQSRILEHLVVMNKKPLARVDVML